MKITVVIPAFNEEKYLNGCLEAVFAQTRPADQVIVVDNNSTDQTRAIVQRFPQAKLLTAKRQGIVFARNRGFDMASGDIIARIDADSRPGPKWLMRVERAFANSQVTAITGIARFYDLPFPLVGELTSWLAFQLSRYWLFGHYLIWGANMAIRRADWLAVRSRVCLSNRVHEDIDLAIHLRELQKEIKLVTALVMPVSMRRLWRVRDLGSYIWMWLRARKFHDQSV